MFFSKCERKCPLWIFKYLSKYFPRIRHAFPNLLCSLGSLSGSKFTWNKLLLFSMYDNFVRFFQDQLLKLSWFFNFLHQIYGIIFITGCVGNISTCLVIARNKSMYSATNYYLFSLAVSDFVLLISGVPMELYHIWYKNEFIFGEAFCILRNMINEMSANATVLTSEYPINKTFHFLNV